MEKYAVLSIETHLFFSRIMREHALFLEAGFPCKNREWIQKADWFRQQFENLLRDAVRMAEGDASVSKGILRSDELVTEFTIPAEKRTEALSGISIDSRISMVEHRLHSGWGCKEERQKCGAVQKMNERAVCLLDGLIEFKEDILREVGKGTLYNANYPLLIQHIIREAKLYRETVEELLCNRQVSYRSLRETEEFWNRIMMEHALFIRGLLDPSEEVLIQTADEFADQYKKLLDMAKRKDGMAADELKKKSLVETLKYREFKEAGTEGILDCKIASIILPLLADHVLREANHYIRILECGNDESGGERHGSM